MRWEELSLLADFVGIALCTETGGEICKFEVEESWKGLSVGDAFITNRPPESGPFAIRKGERCVLFAFKARSVQDHLVTCVNGIEISQGNRTVEYLLPTAQGIVRLPVTGDNDFKSMSFAPADVESLRKAVKEFVSQSPESQELAMLKAKVYELDASGGLRTDESPGAYADLLNRVDASTSVSGLLEVLFERGKNVLAPEGLRVILSCGFKETLNYLREHPRVVELSGNRLSIMKHIRVRAGEITILDL